MSDTTLLVLQKDDFLFIFGDKCSQNTQANEKSIMDQLLGLQETRNKSQSLISKNKFFSQLSSTQKQAFELCMSPSRTFPSGAVIWHAGVLCEFAIMVQKGKIQVSIS